MVYYYSIKRDTFVEKLQKPKPLTHRFTYHGEYEVFGETVSNKRIRKFKEQGMGFILELYLLHDKYTQSFLDRLKKTQLPYYKENIKEYQYLTTTYLGDQEETAKALLQCFAYLKRTNSREMFDILVKPFKNFYRIITERDPSVPHRLLPFQVIVEVHFQDIRRKPTQHDHFRAYHIVTFLIWLREYTTYLNHIDLEIGPKQLIDFLISDLDGYYQPPTKLDNIPLKERHYELRNNQNMYENNAFMEQHSEKLQLLTNGLMHVGLPLRMLTHQPLRKQHINLMEQIITYAKQYDIEYSDELSLMVLLLAKISEEYRRISQLKKTAPEIKEVKVIDEESTQALNKEIERLETLYKEAQSNLARLPRMEEKLTILEKEKDQLITQNKILLEELNNQPQYHADLDENISDEEIQEIFNAETTMIIGGNPNWVQSIREYLPKANHLDTDENPHLVERAKNAKIILYNTAYVNHGMYYKMKTVVDPEKTQIYYIHGHSTNMPITCKELYKQYLQRNGELIND